jgi:hypothetical protein
MTPAWPGPHQVYSCPGLFCEPEADSGGAEVDSGSEVISLEVHIPVGVLAVAKAER